MERGTKEATMKEYTREALQGLIRDSLQGSAILRQMKYKYQAEAIENLVQAVEQIIKPKDEKPKEELKPQEVGHFTKTKSKRK